VPIKTLVGPNVALLLKQAQTAIGADAIILHVRRLRTADGVQFEVAAADPVTAARSDLTVRGTPNRVLEAMAPAPAASGPLVIAVVGPTGAGKTTTIAKLATHPRVFGGWRVGLIGLDTFRIGAIEQLRTYADIARIPCAIAYGGEDLDQARARLADRDVILVDTPGRSAGHRLDREFSHQLIQRLEPAEVHLAIPAGTAPHLARAIIRDSRNAGVTHLLVTKCDEAPDETGVLDLAVELGLPIRWTTDGQDVPFDLASAEERVAASRLSRQLGAGYREAVA